MAKQAPWAVWKIVAVMLGSLAVAGGLFWASAAVGPAGSTTRPADAPATDPGFGMSGLLTLLGAAAVALAVICVGWLVLRWHRSQPTWKRKAKLPPKRR